jgi:signal transduction histidine kinase
MPETLNKHGLIFALRDFLGQKSGKEITIYFTDNTYDIAIENEMAFHLYKITQELIHNSFKYSSANEINVAIFYERIKKQLLYTYDDNGKGFDILKQSDGIGHKNIRTRVTLMNGKLVMDGTQGFSLSITLNL